MRKNEYSIYSILKQRSRNVLIIILVFIKYFRANMNIPFSKGMELLILVM